MKATINFLYTGFLLGYLSMQQITNWADNILLGKLNNDISEDLLLDISLSNNNLSLTSLLLNNIDHDFQYILDYYLSLYHTLAISGKLSSEVLSKEVLAAFSVSNNSFQDKSFIEVDEHYNLFFIRLRDYLNLVDDNLPVNMDMANELDQFLSNFYKDISIFRELDFNVKGIKVSSL